MGDVRHFAKLAVRSLRTDRMLGAGIVACITITMAALSVGASVTSTLLWHSVPGAARSDELHLIRRSYTGPDGTVHAGFGIDADAVRRLERTTASLAGTAAFRQVESHVATDAAEAVRSAAFVNPAYFPVLGVRPDAGHLNVTAPGTAVLSRRLERELFGERGRAVGRTMRVDGRPTVIVGVADAIFEGVGRERTDLWLSWNSAPPEVAAGDSWYLVVVRLRAGVALARAAAAAGRALEFDDAGVSGDGSGIRTELVDPRAADTAQSTPAQRGTWLLAACALVGLVGCANATWLMLVRAERRRTQVAIRSALGASRRWIAVEGVAGVLPLLLGGAALATVLAAVATPWVVQDLFGPAYTVPRRAGLSALLAAFAATAVLLSTIGGGAVIMVHDLRLSTLLSTGGGRSVGPPKGSWADWLLVAQVASATAALALCLLAIDSIREALRVPLGFSPEGVIVVTMNWHTSPTPMSSVDASVLPAALQSVATIPGVQRATQAHVSPLQSALGMSVQVPDGYITVGAAANAFYNAISPDYFEALGTPILRGRAFTAVDSRLSEPVVIVSRSAARAYWSGRSPLGQCLLLGSSPSCWRVVGVVPDALQFQLGREDRYQLYIPRQQDAFGARMRTIIVRVSADVDPEPVRSQIQRAVSGVGLTPTAVRVRRLDDAYTPMIRPYASAAVTLTALAVVTCLLAFAGVASVTAHTIERRLRAIALRQALGARVHRAIGAELRRTIRLLPCGIVAGLGAAALAGPRLAGLLFPTESPRGHSYLLAAAIVVVAVILASLVPMVRVLRLDISELLAAE